MKLKDCRMCRVLEENPGNKWVPHPELPALTKRQIQIHDAMHRRKRAKAKGAKK